MTSGSIIDNEENLHTDEAEVHSPVVALVERCVQGDDEAKAIFFIEYQRLVLFAVTRKLERLTGTEPLRSEVEDICSEVFERLFSNDCRVLARIKKPQSLNAWLVTVSQNHVIDYVRKWSSRTRNIVQETPVNSVHESQEIYQRNSDIEAIERERTDLLQECLLTLAHDERLIVELFFLQGLKYAEIAELLRLNINTVSAKLRRAKEKLRKLLEVKEYE